MKIFKFSHPKWMGIWVISVLENKIFGSFIESSMVEKKYKWRLYAARDFEKWVISESVQDVILPPVR